MTPIGEVVLGLFVVYFIVGGCIAFFIDREIERGLDLLETFYVIVAWPTVVFEIK